MSSKNDENFESKILQLIPEAQEYVRRSNPYLERYLGRLEARILLQMEYFLKKTKFKHNKRKYIVASYPMIYKWFCGVESISSIKRAMKHLMELKIVQKLPLSEMYHKANCYVINYTQCAFVVNLAAQNDKEPPTIDEQYEAWLYAHDREEYDSSEE